MPDGDDFTEWEDEAKPDEEFDRGFLWDPPATPEEATNRANAMGERLLARLQRDAFERGYTEGEPGACAGCGVKTVMRDRTGRSLHPRCEPNVGSGE